MLRILANDGLECTAVKLLTEKGFEVITDHYDESELKEKLKDFDAVIVRSATKIRKEIIDALTGSRLKLVIRAGVGVDNIDVDSAREAGIEVRNTPNASSDSVAELALAHLFVLARHLHHSNVTMKRGEWNKKHYQGTEVKGKTLGFIGFGRIAKSLAEKASALGMKVVYHDLIPAKNMDQYRFVPFETVLEQSDFLSLHIPFSQDQKAVIGTEELAKMKRTAYLINTARGGIVDEKALIDALDAGTIAGAALDVFILEPARNEAVLNHPKISLTPHVGASTDEAQERIGVEAVQSLLEFFQL